MTYNCDKLIFFLVLIMIFNWLCISICTNIHSTDKDIKTCLSIKYTFLYFTKKILIIYIIYLKKNNLTAYTRTAICITYAENTIPVLRAPARFRGVNLRYLSNLRICVFFLYLWYRRGAFWGKHNESS